MQNTGKEGNRDNFLYKIITTSPICEDITCFYIIGTEKVKLC